MGAYAAAKAGVARLTEALAAELLDRGVTVNAILPSIIDTPPNRADTPDADFTRWVKPEQIAATIGFLLSADAQAITGASIPDRPRGIARRAKGRAARRPAVRTMSHRIAQLTETMHQPTILIVEDEVAIADTIIYALGTDGMQTVHCMLGQAALDHLRDTRRSRGARRRPAGSQRLRGVPAAAHVLRTCR